MKLEANNIESAVKQLNRLKSYAPYKFGGVWFLAQIDATMFVAFRTKRATARHLMTNKTENAELYKLG